MIGACARMQTTSWEEEIKLVDGIPYFIDFAQDFSNICLNGCQIEDMSIDDIVRSINPENKVSDVTSYTPSGEDYRRSQKFWDDFYESERKREKHEKKLEKKWNKNKMKRKRRAKWLLEDIDSGLYFVDWGK